MSRSLLAAALLGSMASPRRVVDETGGVEANPARERWLTWDGSHWRAFRAGDEHRPGAQVAREFGGDEASLDPSIVIVTLATSRGIITAAHKRFRARGR